MESRLKKEFLAVPSRCDSTARLGIADTFDIFMDIASEHAEIIGLGGAAMAEKHLFWLTVRTRVRFSKRPGMMERAELETWPGKPGKVRCERYYTLSENGERIIEGKTEWAVLDTESGRLHPVENIYPPELELGDETVCGSGFMRMVCDFSSEHEAARFTVKSTDIDLGGHMNNVAYVRALMGIFSTAELKSMDIRELEISFRAQCYENEELTVCRRDTADAIELAMLKADGKPAVLAKMTVERQL